MQSTLKGNWSDGTPVKLRFVVTSCKLVWPNNHHCESCFKRQADYWGPRQFNMHSLCIRACCHCIHLLDSFQEEQWKWLCDYVGYDYSPFYPVNVAALPKVTNYSVKISRIKRCKMCKEDDAEDGSKYCEACLSFRQRNGLTI